MKKLFKILIPIIAFIALFIGLKSYAVSPCSVTMGCTGISTLTGIPYGTGVNPLSTVTIGSGLSFVGGTLSSTEHGTLTSVSVASSNGLAGTSSGGTTPILTLSTTISGILKGNGTAISAATTTGSGDVVLATSPSLTTPNIGSATASGLTLSGITGSAQCLHVDASGVISGTGADCATGSGIGVGTTAISSGTDGYILYNNAGVLGNKAITGSGDVVLATSPSLTTPSLGAATATSINGIGISGTAGKGINIGVATSGKILIGDGTNMVLSTPTYPTTAGTSGYIMISNGTNWISGQLTSPITRTYTVGNLSARYGDNSSQFDVTNPSGTTYRYTWDGTGTNPNISAATVIPGNGMKIDHAQRNQGTWVITASGTNYFEVTIPSGGYAGTNLTSVTLNSFVYSYVWTKPAGLKYAIVEVVGASGAVAKGDSSTDENGSTGGGGYSKKIYIESSLSATETVSVGIRGFTYSSQTLGGNGWSSSFKSMVSNGSLGTQYASVSGTAGGSATGGDINIPGQNGQISNDSNNKIGVGGGTPISQGGAVYSQSDFSSVRGNYYGAGTSGNITSVNGADGYDGVVIITEYYY